VHRITIHFIRSAVLITPLAVGLVGCSEKATIEDRSTVSTPEGTRTVTKQTKVETTGDNPPPASTPGGAGVSK
jgi:hypothetical protein